jgi:PAS domain S-box-containing protein
VITGPKGEVRWVNPAFTRLTGFTLDEMIGQDLRTLNSGQQSKDFYKELWQTILSGQVWQGELINKRKDGRLYSEEMTITPVTNAAGEIINFVSVKQDITERKKAEADLRARATSLELIAQIGRRTTAILELDELLHQAAQLISDSFNYYNVVIRLIEEDYLVLKATSLSSLQPLAGQAHLKIGQGITGWVAQHGEPLLVPNVAEDHRYHAELIAMQTVSEVAVPIKLKGLVIGVLDTQSVHADEFDEDDVFTLQTIAAQLAVAIENARLYDAAQQEIA